MTSPIIIKAVAKETGVSQKDVKAIADALEVAIKTTVAEGAKFKALDITYSLKDVEEHESRNPATGEKVTVPARKRVKVKVSTDFKKIGE